MDRISPCFTNPYLEVHLPDQQVCFELFGIDAAAPFGAAVVSAVGSDRAQAGTAAWLRIGRGWLIDIDLWHAPFAQRGRLLVAGNKRRAQAWGGWPRRTTRGGEQHTAPPVLAYWARKQMRVLGNAELRLPKGARNAIHNAAGHNAAAHDSVHNKKTKQLRFAFAFAPGALRSVLASAYGRQALSAALPANYFDNTMRAHHFLANYLAALTQIPFSANERLQRVRVEVAGLKQLATAPTRPSTAARGAPAGWLNWLDALMHDAALERWRHGVRAHALVVVADMQPGSGIGNTGLYGLTPDSPQGTRGRMTFPRVALVDANSALSRHMLAHEIGHLIGCQHAPADIDAPRTRRQFFGADAHGWINPQLRLQTATADIDHHAPYTHDVAPLWSDPRTRWGGLPCGRAGYADQASHWLRALPKFLAVNSTASSGER